MKRHLTMIFVLCSVVGFGAETAIAFNEAHLKKLQVFGDCEQCDLSGATLTEATLMGAYLTEATLSKADLRNTYLTEATLTGANLENSKLAGAKFCLTQMPWGQDNSGC